MCCATMMLLTLITGGGVSVRKLTSKFMAGCNENLPLFLLWYAYRLFNQASEETRNTRWMKSTLID